MLQRLRAMNTPFAVKSYDVSPAYQGGFQQDLDDQLLDRFAENFIEDQMRPNVERLLDRRSSLAVRMEGCDRQLYLHPLSGGTMGDSNEGELFMSNFYSGLGEYRRETYLNVASPLTCTSSITGDLYATDASLTAFVDDLLRIILIDTVSAFAKEVNNDLACLTRALMKLDYFQNESKADVSFYASDRKLIREMLADRSVIGNRLTTVKHLGTWIDSFGSNRCDIDLRVQSMNAAWTSLGSFWHSRITFTVRRLFFVSNVISRGLSGMEGMAIRPHETRRLDRAMIGKLRSMMVGKAAHRDGDPVRFNKLSNWEVLRFWQISPTALELMVRRITLFQQIVADPAWHRHCRCIFFGTCRVENLCRRAGLPCLTPPLKADGVIDCSSHDHAQQLATNLECFLALPDASDFASKWVPRSIPRFFSDRSLAEEFIEIDPTALRRQFFDNYWAPHTAYLLHRPGLGTVFHGPGY